MSLRQPCRVRPYTVRNECCGTPQRGFSSCMAGVDRSEGSPSGVTIQQAIGDDFQHYLRKVPTCTSLTIESVDIEPEENFAIQQLIPLSGRESQQATLKNCRGYRLLVTDNQPV